MPIHVGLRLDRPCSWLSWQSIPRSRVRVGTAVMSEAIRRFREGDAVLVWANARDSALHFYEKFGFRAVPKSEFALPESGRPHHLIELDLT
jgi:predicted N-acetyltransferase YhbS